MVSGSDDRSVLVWDKQTTQLLEELKGHEAQVGWSITAMLRLYLFFSLCGIYCFGFWMYFGSDQYSKKRLTLKGRFIRLSC